LITCSFDYLTNTYTNKAFTIYLTVVDFVVPMIPLVYLYLNITKEVVLYYKRQRAVVQVLGMKRHVLKRVSRSRTLALSDVHRTVKSVKCSSRSRASPNNRFHIHPIKARYDGG